MFKDANEIMVKVAAILTTLAETGGSPESMLYIFCNMDMDAWSKMRHILTAAGFVTIKGNFVTLTPVGREKADLINKALAGKA